MCMIAYDLRRGYKFDPKYPMLVARSEKPNDEIPYVDGHNVRADTIARHKKWGFDTAEGIAKDMHLPVGGVEQALAWCEEHKDLVARVDTEERRRLGIK